MAQLLEFRNQEASGFREFLTVKSPTPSRIDEFAGLEKPKRIFTRFAAKPFSSAFLFVGPSGTGNTPFARALANDIDGEIFTSARRNAPSTRYAIRFPNATMRRCLASGFGSCWSTKPTQ